MPIIGPPQEYGVTESQSETELSDFEQNRRIQLFLNVKSWKCICGNTNFGRNLLCADFRCKKPRPPHYTKSKGLDHD